MTDLRVLTLYPEHAALFAAGVRTIETRSKLTNYRGRLLLRAGVRVPQDGLWLGDWLCTLRPRVEVEGHFTSEAKWLLCNMADDAAPILPLQFGKVVASCVLEDCVPIVELGADPTHDHLTVNAGGLIAWAYVPDGERRAWQALDPAKRASNGGPNVDNRSDQSPFGDFSPGRHALLFGDVQPVEKRCPRCWGTGWADDHKPGDLIRHEDAIECRKHGDVGWGGHGLCPTCRVPSMPWESAGRCPPVPMRGRQGLPRPVWPGHKENE